MPAAVDPERVRFETGSFRDSDSRVFYAGGRVFRSLSERGLADWHAFADSGLAAELVSEGKLVTSELVDSSAALPDALAGRAAGVLEHERIPFVSYPYEWPFAMLRDAALLQLELLERAVAKDLILKDSSPYNVQWRGATPVFIDVGSFERLTPGEPWVGYRQFCMLFLYPLLLQAYKAVPFQPWLRGSIEGITPEECRSLMSARDLLRRGVLTHVVLHSRLERGEAERGGDVKRELRAAGFRKELILANLRRLARLIERLEWRPRGSAWSGYTPTTSYDEADAERKADFVRAAVTSGSWTLAWDLGCNDGRHARITAERSSYVVAVDADLAVLDRLYRSLRDEGVTNVLPLAIDVADPSPAQGWRCLERSAFADRGRPDLVLCLALLHHVVISANVPVAEFVEWLRAFGAVLVIEFPTPDDPIVRRLLSRKRPNVHPDYDRPSFERSLSERFEVERSEELAGGTRILYVARPRS